MLGWKPPENDLCSNPPLLKKGLHRKILNLENLWKPSISNLQTARPKCQFQAFLHLTISNLQFHSIDLQLQESQMSTFKPRIKFQSSISISDLPISKSQTSKQPAQNINFKHFCTSQYQISNLMQQISSLKNLTFQISSLNSSLKAQLIIL